MTFVPTVILCACLLSCAVSLVFIGRRLAAIEQILLRLLGVREVRTPVDPAALALAWALVKACLVLLIVHVWRRLLS